MATRSSRTGRVTAPRRPPRRLRRDEAAPPLDRDVHLQNKREAFDGMRAYHQSELSHKTDAIALLTAFLNATILMYGGLLGAVLADTVDGHPVAVAAVLILLAVLVSTLTAVRLTKAKIRSDARRYALYAQEYALERKILGLEQDLQERGLVSAWVEGGPGGAPVTARILTGHAALVIFAAGLGCGFSIAAAYRDDLVATAATSPIGAPAPGRGAPPSPAGTSSHPAPSR